MSLVGIIANPASGKDIRRLVAYGSVFDNQEKVRILRRVLIGLAAVGVERIYYMQDYFGIVDRALSKVDLKIPISALISNLTGTQEDSIQAAHIMASEGAACIVTLGGDGTNRAVVKGSNLVPILPISTGTNNVFPYMVEGTIAGFIGVGYRLRPRFCLEADATLGSYRDGHTFALRITANVTTR